MEYIKADTALHKIRQAYRSGRPVYVSGSAGMGKTAAVKYFLRNQNYSLISGLSSTLDSEPSEEELAGRTLVIDDLSNITDLTSREYVRMMLRAGKNPVILAGRGMLPGWLSAVSAEVGIEVVYGRDLILSDESLRVLFLKQGVNIPDGGIRKVRKDCWDNTWLIILTAQCAGAAGDYTEQALESAKRQFYGYLNQRFYEQLSPDRQRLVISAAPFEHFSARFVQMLSADRRAPAMLEKMALSGDFLTPERENNYRITQPYRSFLVWKRQNQYSEDEQREGNERAALYFELLEQPERALACYREIGDIQRMVRLLSKMIRMHPGTEYNLPVLYRYLHSLPEAAVNAQPILMYGMAMVNSQLYHRELSEEWYQKLAKYRDSAGMGSTQRIDADHLLVLLDLLLPHRGSSGLAATLLRASSITGSWAPYVEGAVLSGGSASLLDGVHDMCEAVSRPQTILNQNMVHTALQKLLGEKAQLYTELFHLELSFEEGSAGMSDFTEKVNRIYMEGEARGEQEICSIAAMLLIRYFAAQGSLSTSENLLESYSKRNTGKQSGRKDREIRRVRTQIRILRGDTAAAGEWMNTAPDSAQLFVFEQRYDYMLEVKALIMLGREDEALVLAQRLEIVFENYRRDYLLVSIRLLKAVILFRREDESWKSALEEALLCAERFRICESAAQEGAALLPLLKKFHSDRVPDDFLQMIRERTQQMAVYYPNYLRSYTEPEQRLTPMEEKVMRLLAGDMTSEQICELLHITYNGLKFHRRNIYRKLGVRSRREAVLKAKALGLCNS